MAEQQSTSIDQIRTRNQWRLDHEAQMAEQFPGGTSWQMMEMARDIADLLDVAEAAQRVYFVFGEGNGPLESLIHRNDLGELGAALQKLPQVCDGSEL